jgi:hypothetical protein
MCIALFLVFFRFIVLLIEKLFENENKKTLQKKKNKIARMEICKYTYILYKIKF